MGVRRVNFGVMDDDDLFATRPTDPLTLVTRQDLGPISQDELAERIATLKAEISRVEQHMAAVDQHRSAADALFKR